jgi:hypothetical protein
VICTPSFAEPGFPFIRDLCWERLELAYHLVLSWIPVLITRFSGTAVASEFEQKFVEEGVARRALVSAASLRMG